MVEPQSQNLDFPPGSYTDFYTQFAMQIWKNSPDTSLTFKKTPIYKLDQSLFMYKTMSLPGNKVFVLGGAKDIGCATTSNQT